ncbi:MAG TPA: hypothetical protein VIM19_14850 [Actinomycetes bacterium]
MTREKARLADDNTNDDVDDNQVRLTGTVADSPQLRVLPSGDEVATVRRTVSGWRPASTSRSRGRRGARFWRTPSGPASRYEVVVERGRRLGRA